MEIKIPQIEKINEYKLIVGYKKFSVPKELEFGKRYIVQVELDVDDFTTENKQDGSIDVVYKGRQTGVGEIITEIEKIKIKKDITPSQKLRYSIETYHDKHFGDKSYEFVCGDKETFYEEFIKRLMWDLDNIIRLLFTKI